MTTEPKLHNTNAVADPDVVGYAERLGVSVAEAARILERKAADPDALSFMPGPDDAASREAYDSWGRAKIQEALEDPRPSLSQEEVEAHFAKRRAAVLASSKE